MPASLPDLQRRFAAAIEAAAPGERLAIYRNAVRANYRNALGASYPVVRELTGAPFFHAAVDAFVEAHPSTGGDLNVYGDAFPQFLARYPHARSLPYLPDVARLEWALDEAMRAGDAEADPEGVLRTLAATRPDAVAALRASLDPSCRLVRSAFPVMRIWQVHQDDGDRSVDLEAGPDHLVVRREGDVPSIARVPPAGFAFLEALAAGASLGDAVEAALGVEASFDVGLALRTFIADGTLVTLTRTPA
ncbi:MAG: DNA-binding domain-containing protein [Burkholderiales bacterium]